MNSAKNLSAKFKELLEASGLVDGIAQVGLLKPLYKELMENEILCKPGDVINCIWVIIKGTIAVKENGLTLVTRSTASLVGEFGIIDNKGGRRAELVAVNGAVEILEISLISIESHPQSQQIWKNFARLLCIKLDESSADKKEIRYKLMECQNALRLYVGEYALSVEKLAPERVLLKPKHETAVIWFSDIVGFSKLSSLMPPTNAASLVQKFLNPQVHSIDLRKGYIDKFMGDGVMAYWIVQSKLGKSEVEIALDAAKEVLDSIEKIKVGDTSLSIRIGLHIGIVSIGNFGTQMRSQFTLIGHEVNKAARLEQAKNSQQDNTGDILGSIRTSNEFYKLLSEKSKKELQSLTFVNSHNIGGLQIHSSIR